MIGVMSPKSGSEMEAIQEKSLRTVKAKHPSYEKMILEAFGSIRESQAGRQRKSVTRAAIANYIHRVYFEGERQKALFLAKGLKKLVETKQLAVSGAPRQGRYVLVEQKKKAANTRSAYAKAKSAENESRMDESQSGLEAEE